MTVAAGEAPAPGQLVLVRFDDLPGAADITRWLEESR